MSRRDLTDEIRGVAALAEPVRRALYHAVVARGEASREQAARAARISRALAAFHLDKLVDAGLLEVSYRRLTGRQGPGAGRPAKVYRRAGRDVQVLLPERRYELVAQLMAQALAGRAAGRASALRGVARRFGRRLGLEARRRAKAPAGRRRLLEQAEGILRDHGFEPYRSRGEIRLRNCPFDAVAREQRALVCGANLAIMGGVVAGLGVAGIRARLDPAPGRCCVVLSLKT